MATEAYGMGQYRYSKNFSYATADGTLNLNNPDNNGILYYDNVGVSTDSTKYRDIILAPSTRLVMGKSYYLRLALPQNPQYEMEIQIKLFKGDSPTTIDLTQYQMVRRILVPSDPGSRGKYSRILLYPANMTTPDGAPTVAIAKEKIAETNIGDIYFDETANGYYQITRPGMKDGAISIDYFNDVILNHTWEIGGSASMKYYDIIFSPKYNIANGFNYFLLEIVRKSHDQDIQYKDGGVIYHGLKIDREIMQANLYELKNLIGTTASAAINPGTTALSHIGVWGRPDLPMSINGEEIRVGQSGFYELSDFNITSLGVAALSDVDRFTVDYQYKIAE